MNILPFKRNYLADLNFLALTMLVWTAYFWLQGYEGGDEKSWQILFIGQTAIVAFLFLNTFHYFDTVRVPPRIVDLILLMVAFPFAVGGTIITQHSASDDQRYSTGALLTWSIISALLVYVGQTYFQSLSSKFGHKRKVLLDLLPAEREALMDRFEAFGASNQIEFLALKDLRELILRGALHEIDIMIISRGAVNKFDSEGLHLRAHLAGVPILDHLRVTAILTGRIRIPDTDLATFLLDATRQTPILRVYSALKIIVEPILAAALFVMFAPLMVILAILIKISSVGPVFYWQQRTGHHGEPFALLKFRSMFIDSEVSGPQWCSPGDSRVTMLGRFMRRTRLDELPQLWNVLRGEMGFLGPRPERPEIYKSLEQSVPLFSVRVLVRPGISGWAQVCAGYAASVEESQLKLEYDLFYIQHMSPRVDVIILLKTLKIALLGDRISHKVVLNSPLVVQRS